MATASPTTAPTVLPTAAKTPVSYNEWPDVLKLAAEGQLSNSPFPQGNFSGCEVSVTGDATYELLARWSVADGSAFRMVDIHVIYDPKPEYVYNASKEQSLRPRRIFNFPPPGWSEWPAGYPSGKDQDADVEICGATDFGLKVCWVQKGARGKVSVLLESMAGHLVLRKYADGVAKAVRQTLK